MKPITILILALLLAACGKKEDPNAGRVITNIGEFVAVVVDCPNPYTTVPQTLEPTADSLLAFRFVPCTGADIMVEGSALKVNGSPYGSLQPGDTVLVDHGQVFINGVKASVQYN
jgi:hypothetical protein